MIDEKKQMIFKEMSKEFLDPLTVPIIGFGGAAGAVLEKVTEKIDKDQELQFSKVRTIHFSTKNKESRILNVKVQFQITSQTLGEHDDTEGFVEIGEKILEETLENLSQERPKQGDIIKDLKNAEAVLLVAGLGGGMGTGGIMEMLYYLKKNAPGVPVITFLIWPFNFEKRGVSAREYTEKILEITHRHPTIIRNQEFFKETEKNEKFRYLLDRINEYAAEKIMEQVDFIRREREIAFKRMFEKVYEEEFELATKELNIIAK